MGSHTSFSLILPALGKAHNFRERKENEARRKTTLKKEK
jgi:hypothetical protein